MTDEQMLLLNPDATAQYNTDRPHRVLDAERPATPGDRFTPIPEEQRDLLTLVAVASLGARRQERRRRTGGFR